MEPLFFLRVNVYPRRFTPPGGRLIEAIDRDFGSFENFQLEFKKAALTRFGSVGLGYAATQARCLFAVLLTRTTP